MRLFYLIEIVVAYLFYCTGFYWFRRKTLERRGAAVVLVYHRVTSGRRGLGEMVGEEALERQMRYLRERCRLVDWKALLAPGAAEPGIRVLVTFDDGYRDAFTRALPILERYRVPSIFFAATNLVFRRERIEEVGAERDEDLFPSEDELRRAAKSAFVVFGNHTASHQIVSAVPAATLEEELRASQREFSERLGVIPETFAYPRGRRDDVTEAAIPILEKLGFKAAFTMIPGLVGPGTNRYLVPRVGMSHVNDEVLFKVKMVGLLNALVQLKNALKL